MTTTTGVQLFRRPHLGDRLQLGGCWGEVKAVRTDGMVFEWDKPVRADGTRIYAALWFLDWSKVKDLTRKKLNELQAEAEAVVPTQLSEALLQ